MNNDSEAGSRRSFLQSTAALSGALALQAKAGTGNTPPPRLPTVKFGKTEITRLIIGSNPFYGYSHFNRIFDAHMREFYTQDKKMEVLKSAERNGINTWQLHYNDQPLADYLRYREEGGNMNIVLLADFELMKNPKIMPDVVAKMKPMGVGHHGNWTDNRFRAGEKLKVREFCKIVRDSGVMVGVSAHNPSVFDVIESEDWDVDYFQTCLYRVSRTAGRGPLRVRRGARRRNLHGEGPGADVQNDSCDQEAVPGVQGLRRGPQHQLARGDGKSRPLRAHEHQADGPHHHGHVSAVHRSGERKRRSGPAHSDVARQSFYLRPSS